MINPIGFEQLPKGAGLDTLNAAGVDAAFLRHLFHSPGAIPSDSEEKTDYLPFERCERTQRLLDPPPEELPNVGVKQ